jgi:hypothetical protein
MDLGKEGSADIDCAVAPGGRLADCRVVKETPDGFGFGAAALRLSALFRMKDGHKGERTRIPINFALSAAPGGADEVIMTKKRELSWARQAGSDDLDRVRPASAAGPGSVTLRCHVKSARKLPSKERGTLYDCLTVKEEPANAGFGQAAQALVPMFQFEGAGLPPLDPAATIDLDLAWAPKAGR